MSFKFPDPQTTPEFTGDNGITYLWDADDSKWQIKGFAVEQREDFDPQLKGHVCAEFFEVVVNHETVTATKSHSMATYDFGGDKGVKYWTKPPKADFFVNGESYYINEAGPFEIGTVDASKKWVTFFIKDGPTPAVGEFCTFSKTRKLCTEVSFLQNEIIELEEEIDAIAPSVERGTWKFNLGGAVSNRGQVTMYDGMNKTGSPIGLFKSAKSIWLNELDSDGTPHGFAGVSEGDLIELFVQGDADYGLFTVVAVHDETEGTNKYWVIDVNFVRALSPDSKADNADNLRVKIIQPPNANGDAGGDGNDHLNRKYNMTIAWKSYAEDTYTMVANNNESKWSNSSFGGHGAEVFKDLYKWFPPEEYEFIPGDIIWFELEVSGGRAWEVQPPHAVFSFHATNVIEFTSARQHLQGHSSWAGFGVNDQQPDRSKTHQVIFQCFRRKG